MYSSLYPSILRQFNVAPNTMIGLLIIDAKVHNKENRRRSDTWTRAGAFMEDFQSQVWLEVNSRWFNLSDYTTLYHEVEEFFTKIMQSQRGLRLYQRNGLIDPIITVNDRLINQGLIFEEDNRRPIEDIYIKPDLSAWEEFRNVATVNKNQLF